MEDATTTRLRWALDDMLKAATHVLHTLGPLAHASPEATDDDREAFRHLVLAVANARDENDDSCRGQLDVVSALLHRGWEIQNERNAARELAANLQRALDSVLEADGSEARQAARREAHHINARALIAMTGWRKKSAGGAA